MMKSHLKRLKFQRGAVSGNVRWMMNHGSVRLANSFMFSWVWLSKMKKIEMCNRVHKAILLLLASVLPMMAVANEQTTVIDQILLWDGLQDSGTLSGATLVYVYPHDPIPVVLGCATGTSCYSFSMSRPMAKEYLAALLAAKLSGSPVYLRGLGWCKDQSTSETLVYSNVK